MDQFNCIKFNNLCTTEICMIYVHIYFEYIQRKREEERERETKKEKDSYRE